MKPLNNYLKLSTLALGLMITFAACSSVNNEVETLSEEDIEVATVILTESTADETSGIMNSMYDAFSTVGTEGIAYGDSPESAKSNGDDEGNRGGRSSESNFSYSYDPDTGTHTIEFSRSVSNERVNKQVSLVNTYIFTNPENEWIAYPRAERNSIEAIDFTSNIAGSIEAQNHDSEFARMDTFYISGLHASSSTLGIDGSHKSFGETNAVLDDGETNASRSYELSIDMDDIQISKDSVATYGNLEQGVTGTLSYSLAINTTVGNRIEQKVVEGSIEFAGDGTALLRFEKVPQVIRFSLRDGSRDDGE